MIDLGQTDFDEYLDRRMLPWHSQRCAVEAHGCWFGPHEANYEKMLAEVRRYYPHMVRYGETNPSSSDCIAAITEEFGPEGLLRPGNSNQVLVAPDPGRWVLIPLDISREHPNAEIRSSIHYAVQVFFHDENDAFEFKMKFG